MNALDAAIAETSNSAIGATVSFFEYDYRGGVAGVLSGEVIGYVGTHTMRIETLLASGRQVFRRTPVQLARDGAL